jgi:hypothetical protein
MHGREEAKPSTSIVAANGVITAGESTNSGPHISLLEGLGFSWWTAVVGRLAG